MNWKEFFKPTKEKIIIAIIILLIAGVSFLLTAVTGLFLFGIIGLITLCPYLIKNYFGYNTGVMLEQLGYSNTISIILMIIWLYFLTCIISFIYNKYKKR